MLSGTLVGDRYEIETEVARGARGVIYKSREKNSGKVVAIKVLTDDMINDESAFDRFSVEAQTASVLKHPNIINVFDFGLTDDGFAYLVMEYLEGPTLQEVIDAETRLSLRRAVTIFIQIADALGYAHSKGTLHRDVKPENIILWKSGATLEYAKVVDFGIARRFSVLPGADLATEGQCLGTPGYMSPEQVMGERHLDARTDIYSLGCLMYTAITGVMPITAPTPDEILSRHLSVDPLPLSKACPGALIPGNVQEVVLKTLKKFPEHRYQTMAQLKADLELLLR
jgi:serine/threonine-protein kinase